MIRPTFLINESSGEAIAFLSRVAKECEMSARGEALNNHLILRIHDEMTKALHHVMQLNIIPPSCAWKNKPQIRTIGYDIGGDMRWSTYEVDEEFAVFNLPEYASSQDIIIYVCSNGNMSYIKISIDGFVRRLLGGI